ncbi:MAG: aldo/keto reductase, partial [Coriobacteriales bacterium]|nr:aldo/keto reductase [Coriobacteriales bacterium]
MIRRTISGASVPSFGFGTMRMPIVDGDIAKVDEDALKEMVDYAMDHGVNYFDLGYGYHGDNDEISVCKVLREYPRESYLIADKFPIYDLSHFERIEEIFELQLERTQLDYFDLGYGYHG